MVDNSDDAPYRRNGITADSHTRHPLRDTPDWQIAKTNANGQGIDSARRIIDQLWKPEFSAEVAERIKGLENVCFVTVPSTSGNNQLPIALAERLREDLQSGQVIIGEKIARSGDMQPMKDVPLLERPFIPRRYVLREPCTITAKNNVVIVEDIMSSGASAKAFADCLLRNKIPVITTVCLLGKPKLFAEPVLFRDLQRCFEKNGIELDARQVADVLAKNQIILLIEHIKRRKNDIPRITERISRVLDSRAFGYVERNPQWKTEDRGLSDRKNMGYARSADGIRDQPYCTDHARNGGSPSPQSETQPPVAKKKKHRIRWVIWKEIRPGFLRKRATHDNVIRTYWLAFFSY